MGFDSYNPWTPTNGTSYKSVKRTMSPGKKIQRWGYPVLVAETGVHADPAHPRRAANWLRRQYRYALKNNFLGISYFNSTHGSRDGGWVLHGERLRAFGQNLRRNTTARIKG